MQHASPVRPGRPQSIKELAAQAENFQFNVNISLKYWTRTAETLYQEVPSYLLTQALDLPDLTYH